MSNLDPEDVIRALLFGGEEALADLDQKLRLEIAQSELDPHTTRTYYSREDGEGSIYVQLIDAPMMENVVQTRTFRNAEVSYDINADGVISGVEIYWHER